jgi:glycosyltransferase involved in cell wall biosynthesis
MLESSLPKITIIIGVLNMQRYLGAAIDSVLQQNYPNVELIIMDGLSTDGTLDVIKHYDKHIAYWVSQKDKGHCDACNNAIDVASGDFVILLNADDTLGENLLHKVAAIYAMKPETKIITCGVRIFEKDARQNVRILKEITRPEKLQITLHNMLFELPVINARFFHKDIFHTFGKFHATHADGSYNLSNDRDYLVNLALAGIQSEIIPEPLYLYFSHEESLTFSQKNQIKTRREHIKIAEKYLQQPAPGPAQKKLIRAWLANESVYLALIYFFQNNLTEAFRAAKQGYFHTHFMFIRKFFSITAKTLFKKSKRIFVKP